MSLRRGDFACASGACQNRAMAVGAALMADSQRQPPAECHEAPAVGTDEREKSEESSGGGAEEGSDEEARAQDDGNDPDASELSDLESAEGHGHSPAPTPADGIR